MDSVVQLSQIEIGAQFHLKRFIDSDAVLKRVSTVHIFRRFGNTL